MSKLVDRAFLPQGSLNSAVKRLKLKRSKGLFIEAIELTKTQTRNIIASYSYDGLLCDRIYGFNNLYKSVNSTYYYVELRKEDANS